MYTELMKTLILGGNSPRHYKWIRALGTYLESCGHKVVLHDYKHWSTGEKTANIDDEIAAIATLMRGEHDYAVIGKSVGTVITALATARGKLTPQRCVLLGIPYEGIAGATADFLPSLNALPGTVIFQNTDDPYGGAAVIRDHVLSQTDNDAITFIETPGDTHDYLDFARIATCLHE